MKKFTPSVILIQLFVLGAFCLLPEAAKAQKTNTLGTFPTGKIYTLSKLYDFSTNAPSARNPYDTAILIGNELFFTTQSGGTTAFGTLSKYNLTSSTLTSFLPTMDITTGNTPHSSFTLVGDQLYYTTTRGGTGDRGTLSVIHTNGTGNTVLFNSLPNSPSSNLNTFPGNVAAIDRGVSGFDIYFMAQNGGPLGAAGGGIYKYNTVTSNTVAIHTNSIASDGRQPFEGFTQVGSDLYYTTFTGGISGSGFSNGAGTLNKLDTSTDTVTKLANLPGDVNQSTRFPAHNPVFDSFNNSLYFTTAGTSTQPGSIQKFDLTTSTLSTLYSFQYPQVSGEWVDGRFAYGPMALVGDFLYYTTIQGGENFTSPNPSSGAGVISRFDLVNLVNEVIFSLGQDTFGNWGNEARGGFTVRDNGDGTQDLFLLARSGGAEGVGTLLQMNIQPIPEPRSIGLLLLSALLTFVGIKWNKKKVLCPP